MIKREFSRSGREEARLAKTRSRRQTGVMARTLNHLPGGKRAELAFVVDVLKTGFDEERSRRRSERLANGVILRIILYGSYARGDWVEDPVGRYFSDYDLLIVVADEKHADVLEFWGTAEKRLLAELSSGERLRTPVNFIVHSQAEVDDALIHGRYVFMDIMADGVLLLKAPDALAFFDPQHLAPDVAPSETQAQRIGAPSVERFRRQIKITVRRRGSRVGRRGECGHSRSSGICFRRTSSAWLSGSISGSPSAFAMSRRCSLSAALI